MFLENAENLAETNGNPEYDFPFYWCRVPPVKSPTPRKTKPEEG
jgi:hypothetical protein